MQSMVVLLVLDVERTLLYVQNQPISVLGSESASAKLVETYTATLMQKIRPGREFFHYVDELAKEELLKADQLQRLTAGSGAVESSRPKGSRHWNAIVRLQRDLQDGKVTVAEFLQTLSINTSPSLLSSKSQAGRPTDAQVDDNGDEAEEVIELPLCDKCGAAQRQKFVLQPCGHVWKCRHCYHAQNGDRTIACPVCKTSVTGHVMF